MILTKRHTVVAVLIVVTFFSMASAQRLPRLKVTSDDVQVTQSCRIVILPNTIIEDKNNNGVIHIVASDIEIEFESDAVLRGSPQDGRPDEYQGYGIRIDGQTNVSIRGGKINGFWCGLWATGSNGLMLDRIDASDNRRAYLKSTPAAEDSGDWLFPHNNDNNEWLQQYGSAIYIEDANDVTVRRCTVRHGQNALCLDRVNDSKIYDNDFSFNSGWGIAMWRSNRNVISRNACDFCVRGYSHGVYNRGQDSAGILMFEQNNENILAENSATHGGDGFFGFAGHEALGQTGSHEPTWYKRRGNNMNLLIDNDFSYAPAHGIEMTFSFGNAFYDNRLVENAICGIWGGYSQDTLITKNHIEGNGEMAYGLERGGVNIEHGIGNRIVDNTFKNNKCGVHLWSSDPGDMATKPWAKANGTESKDNLIAHNTFTGDVLAYHFRGTSEVTLNQNVLTNVEKAMQTEKVVVVHYSFDPAEAAVTAEPRHLVFGLNHPVGARKHLRGRQNIIMTEWGPWDHQSPLIRKVQDNGNSVQYSLHEVPPAAKFTLEGPGVTGQLSRSEAPDQTETYTISTSKPGVYPYRLIVKTDTFQEQLNGTLISAIWDVTFFKWTEETDPREALNAWRELAKGETAVSAQTGQLVFPYGWGGPSNQNISESVTAAKLDGNHFGMIATTTLPLSAGTWKLATLSDDGVRVTIDGQTVIENWAWHGPTRDTGTFELTEDKTIEVRVEHFEIDGYATLELTLSR